jgi:hypothetical protein
MEQENILDYKRLEVKLLGKADDDIVRLLEKAVLGSEKGMRYSMQNIGERIKNYGDSLSFMALYKKGKLAGAVGLCRRKTLNCGTPIESTYLRYLAISSTFQAPASAGRHAERLTHTEESFKHKLFSMFSQPGSVPGKGSPDNEPHINYAYVESRNERSRNLVHQAGYEYIRSFLTLAFSRFNPSPRHDVTKLSPQEEPAMGALLREYYSGYCFYNDEFSFFNHGYYVLRQNNEIIAGVCAIPTSYMVVNVPGVWGWVMMKVFPKTPYFRRLFRPGEFRYLVFSAVYCRKGSEHLLPDLFEAVCAGEGYNTALTWLDDHSELYESLRTNRRMGVLNRILNAKPGLVYALFPNITDEAKEKFYDSPAYISGFDFS